MVEASPALAFQVALEEFFKVQVDLVLFDLGTMRGITALRMQFNNFGAVNAVCRITSQINIVFNASLLYKLSTPLSTMAMLIMAAMAVGFGNAPHHNGNVGFSNNGNGNVSPFASMSVPSSPDSTLTGNGPNGSPMPAPLPPSPFQSTGHGNMAHQGDGNLGNGNLGNGIGFASHNNGNAGFGNDGHGNGNATQPNGHAGIGFNSKGHGNASHSFDNSNDRDRAMNLQAITRIIVIFRSFRSHSIDAGFLFFGAF